MPEKPVMHGRDHRPGGYDPIPGLRGAFVLASTDDQDISAGGGIGMLWTDIYNNSNDFDSLTSLPAGLGLHFAFDGSDGTIYIDEDGVWAFTYNLGGLSIPDATIQGHFELSPVGIGQTPFFPMNTGSGVQALETTEVLALPAGATFVLDVTTTIAATSSPYLASSEMAITRLI